MFCRNFTWTWAMSSFTDQSQMLYCTHVRNKLEIDCYILNLCLSSGPAKNIRKKWSEYLGQSHGKFLVNGPNPTLKKTLLQLDRIKLRRVVGLFQEEPICNSVSSMTYNVRIRGPGKEEIPNLWTITTEQYRRSSHRGEGPGSYKGHRVWNTMKGFGVSQSLKTEVRESINSLNTPLYTTTYYYYYNYVRLALRMLLWSFEGLFLKLSVFHLEITQNRSKFS